jgi:hypothetical protein
MDLSVPVVTSTTPVEVTRPGTVGAAIRGDGCHQAMPVAGHSRCAKDPLCRHRACASALRPWQTESEVTITSFRLRSAASTLTT